VAKDPADQFPICDTYKGIGLHDFQPAARIANTVKPEIDRVAQLRDVDDLYAFALDSGNSPEARTFARAKVEAYCELAADERRSRPKVDLGKLRAKTAGLGSLRWASETYYAGPVDVVLPPGALRPIARDPQSVARLRAYRQRWTDERRARFQFLFLDL
jgi:hypothetical protein